jgi:putative Mg2+ transporter-C (MgtC) family protein
MDLLKEELFAGLPDWTEAGHVVVRLLLAVILGGIVGFERERAGKAAGLRTHILVSLGAAVFVVAAMQAQMGADAVSRIIQGLVTGIGFLGGGAIIKARDKSNVEGLTTAAGIWLTAGLGAAAGLGTAGIALLSAILAWVVLSSLYRLEKRIRGSRDH